MPATLERPLKLPARPEGDFVVFDDRPVFCEHTATDGTVYDRQRLAEICENQNARIRETGDFTPVVLGHTPNQYERLHGASQPEVIGFAGPFKLGLIGDETPKWAILGRFHVFQEEERRFRKNPRCSVELWPDDKIFDPISVLGAETPKLDLGMHYSRRSDGQRVARYTAVAPSGSNVFVPACIGDDDDKRKPKQTYSAEDTGMALSPEDIGQIVDALKSTAEFQWIQQRMQAEAGVGDDLDDGAPAPPAEDPNAADGDGDPEPQNQPPTGGDKDRYRKEKAMPAPAAAAAKARDTETEDLKIKYAKAQKEAREYKDRYERLEADVESLKFAKTQAERQAALIDLANSGYAIDVSEELADCQEMDAKAFDKHLERVRTKYSRAPVGRSLFQEKPEKFAKAEAESVALSNKAREHALKNGTSYAAALEAVQTKAA